MVKVHLNEVHPLRDHGGHLKNSFVRIVTELESAYLRADWPGLTLEILHSASGAMVVAAAAKKEWCSLRKPHFWSLTVFRELVGEVMAHVHLACQPLELFDWKAPEDPRVLAECVKCQSAWSEERPGANRLQRPGQSWSCHPRCQKK